MEVPQVRQDLERLLEPEFLVGIAVTEPVRLGLGEAAIAVRFLLRHMYVVCAHLSDGGRQAVIVQSHTGPED
jgi:hypothetical protein